MTLPVRIAKHRTPIRIGNIMNILRTLIIAVIIFGTSLSRADETAGAAAVPIKIGWIGPMTGTNVKWGSYQAVQLALAELNEERSASGRGFELIFEDGKGSGKDAANAAQKLLKVDQVKFILGGHCSPESLAIAPLVERSGALMIASVTSNPFLTNAGDHVFRVTAISTTGTEKIHQFASANGLKSFAVLYEESDYPRPQAEKLKALIEQNKQELRLYDGLLPGETDFKSILIKLKQLRPDALYLATISPDVAVLIMRQIRELHLNLPIFGNENTGYAVNHSSANKADFEGLTFAASKTGDDEPKVKAFKEQFLKTYKVEALPYGYYTAESYDTLMLLAGVIKRCGAQVEEVKRCLYGIKDYEGASGRFSIDQNGDAVREYQMLKVVGGKVVPALE